MSLSRLNHGPPWGQAPPEVGQGTAPCHHPITDAFLPQADAVLHDTAAVDTAVAMLNPSPTSVQGQIGPLLLSCQLLAAWFLGGHEDLDLGQRERQKAQVLQEPASRRQRIRRGIHNGLIMGAAAIGVAQEEDEKQGVDEQDIFHRVVFFLAAITIGLFSRVLGADDAPFRPVMGKSRYDE